jgi:hypothetical protein
MTRIMLTACVVGAVAATVGIGAQAPQSPAPQSSTPSITQTEKETVTVTGCLKAWDGTAAGARTGSAPGATGSAASATKFMLISSDDAATAKMPSSTATPSAAARESSAVKSGRHYVVTAGAGVNLSSHLDHKVRITGKTSGTSASMTRPDATTQAPVRPDAPAPSAGAMRGDQAHGDMVSITASSVTMISATCEGAQ